MILYAAAMRRNFLVCDEKDKKWIEFPCINKKEGDNTIKVWRC